MFCYCFRQKHFWPFQIQMQCKHNDSDMKTEPTMKKTLCAQRNKKLIFSIIFDENNGKIFIQGNAWTTAFVRQTLVVQSRIFCSHLLSLSPYLYLSRSPFSPAFGRCIIFLFATDFRPFGVPQLQLMLKKIKWNGHKVIQIFYSNEHNNDFLLYFIKFPSRICDALIAQISFVINANTLISSGECWHQTAYKREANTQQYTYMYSAMNYSATDTMHTTTQTISTKI